MTQFSTPAKSMHLLHLEDSDLDAELLADYIRQEWPDCTIDRVIGRTDFSRALQQPKFDLILSDYSIPGFDGLSALELAQKHAPLTPFIFVSGTIGEERAVEALKRGATDYIIKDRPQRLTLSIRQALERVEESQRRRQADRRIREQAALLDQARDAICVVDRNRRITYWNASAERIFGWTEEEACDWGIGELLFAPDATSFEQAFAETLSRGEWMGELRTSTKDGRLLVVDSHWTRVKDHHASSDTLLLIMTDATERRRLESEILRAQRIESIGMFAGAIAHDLNNVLTPILMGTGLLRSQIEDERALRVVANLETSAEHGAALVQQLLAFARGADGSRTMVDLANITPALTRLVRQSLPPAITLEIDLEPMLWSINADVTQLSQVLLNLCINARDAMSGRGSIRVTIRNITTTEVATPYEFHAQPGMFVRISVSDTGCGIPPENLEKIFDPFFTTKAPGKGTGLGLSSVVAIMKNHQGFVTVESEVGRGTTFHVYFPAVDPSAAMLDDSMESGSALLG
jgi:two-component system, cell cycle sensor histidine kinase and response regulator CckA